MKFTFDKEWLLKRAAAEDKEEIAAGALHLDLVPTGSVAPGSESLVPAFGRLINLCRRKHGWSVEELAGSARISVAELMKIEHEPHYIPGPRTVYQLSTTLGLPKERMLQLSGNMVVRDSRFGEEAVRFAARSESIAKLSKEEHEALEEFVKYLSEAS